MNFLNSVKKMMQTAVIHFDRQTEIKKIKTGSERKGKLSSQEKENKLMRTVLNNDKNKIKEGTIIKEALNVGLNAFTPDLLFEQITKNYSVAKKLYGPKLIRELTDYNPGYVDRNIKIPEFQREVRKNITKNVEKLKKEGILEKDGAISEMGYKLASLILYTEELDKLIPKGFFGRKVHKDSYIYGDKEDIKDYKKGDRYRDLAIKKSITLAIRRGSSQISKDNLKSHERQSKGQIYLIYALDSSGSMKGKKIEACKKAGIALAFKAIDERDKVGLMVFGSEIKEKIMPTLDFRMLLDRITRIKAAKETNLAKTIKEAVNMFPRKEATKHLMLITDAMPTVGKNPEKETLEAVSLANASGITISLIGTGVDKKAVELANKITSLGKGKLYVLKDLENLDRIVLEDYYSI